MSTSGQWFRKRIGSYSEELSKSFSEAKACVQRGLEQLKLKNIETFKRIPSFRGSFRAGNKENKKTKSSPKKIKSPKKKLQPNSPSRSPVAERSRTFTANSADLNATYRITRKAFNHTVNQSCLYGSSESELDETEHTLLSKTHKPFSKSHSFPRVNRSRKIENINIVFAKPFPPVESPPIRKKISSTITYKTEPQNINKDAFNMNNLRKVMSEIHAKRSRMNPVRKPPRIRQRKQPKSLDASYSPERQTSSEEDSIDSELNMSMEISLRSSDSEVENDDSLWMPKLFDLPRTSSRLSMQSKSSGYWGASPELSPIKDGEKRLEQESQLKRAWGMTYKLKKDKATAARKLFSIDEMLVVDSGYSDRSGANSRATSSRATMYELQNRRVTPSPTSSTSPSPTPAVREEDENQVASDKPFSKSGPYVLKSYYV